MLLKDPGLRTGLLRIDAAAPPDPIFSPIAAKWEIKLQHSPARAALPVGPDFVLMVLSYL
jgi:hypothetical protein